MDIAMAVSPRSRLIMIRCPRLSSRSPIVASLLEEGVVELAKHGSASAVGAGGGVWFYTDWLSSKLNDFLNPPFDGVQFTAADWNNLAKQKDLYCQEVYDWIKEIINLNTDMLHEFDTFKVNQARVIRRYPDFWIIELRG